MYIIILFFALVGVAEFMSFVELIEVCNEGNKMKTVE